MGVAYSDVAGASEPDAQGSVGVQLLEAPTNRRHDPRARRYIVDHLKPGTEIWRRILVMNKSPRRQRIDVYPAAATLDGERFIFGAGRAANDLTSWISLEHGQVELKAHSQARIRVKINVPPTAPAGERYAVIWASVASKPKASANVNQVHRTGVRVYLDIGRGGEPVSGFAIGELRPARGVAGEPSLGIQVTNTGGRALDLTGSVDLSDGPSGMRAGPFEVVKGTTLAPRSSGSVVVGFPRELPNGPWKVDVNLASGSVKQTASGRITFPDPGQPGKASESWSGVRTAWMIAGGSLGLGLILVAGLAFVALRSRRKAGSVSGWHADA